MRCHTLYQSEDRVWRLFCPDAAPPHLHLGAGANLLTLSAGGETVLFDPGGAAAFGEMLAALTGEIALESVAAVIITRAGLETASALPLWRRVCQKPLRVFAPAGALGALAALDETLAPEILPAEEDSFAPVEGCELNVIPAPQLPSADAVSLFSAQDGVLYTAAAGAGDWDESAAHAAPFVENFTRRAEAMAAHHARMMPSAAARRAWTARVRGLDVRFMVPERGPVLRAAAAARFFEWFEETAPGAPEAPEAGEAPISAPVPAPESGPEPVYTPQEMPGWSAAETAAHAFAPEIRDENMRGAVLAASAQNPDAGAEREAALDAALGAALDAAAARDAARDAARNTAGPHAGEGAAPPPAPPHALDARLIGETARTLDDAAVLDAALGGRSGELEDLDEAVDKAIEDAAVLEASDAAGENQMLSIEDLDQVLDDLIDETIYMPVLHQEYAPADGPDDAEHAEHADGTAFPAAFPAAGTEPETFPETDAETADAEPETGGRFRLITRSDFDGVACAVLLEEMELIREINFVHPKDMQDGLIPVGADDITANMPFTPGAHLAFDHHASESGRVGAGADTYINDPKAPSAARVIYDFFGGQKAFPGVSVKMLEAADKGDSGRFSMDEVLDPKDWDLLHFIIDARTGLRRFREFRVPHYEMMMDLVDACRSGDVADILAAPDVKERVDLYMRHRGPFEEQVKRCADVKDGLAVLDLRGEETIYAGNRFLIYALFPQCTASMHVMWGPERRNVVFACGKSIFDRSAKIDIGRLMLEYGGGGHPAAGTCQIGVASAERALDELTERIIQEG